MLRYRLTGVNDASGVALDAYTYNRTGDRTSKSGSGVAIGSYHYATGTHLLGSIGTSARTYDANGNTTGTAVGTDTFGFGYNDRNRLTTAQRNGQTVATYTYNAFGQRIGKVATFPSSVSERYAYDEAGHLIGENGDTQLDYIWADDLPVAVIDNHLVGGLSFHRVSTFQYVQADGLNTPRAVTNSMGTVIWVRPYVGDGFGEEAPTSSTGYVLNLRFPGQYYDAETGTNYNMFRTYEPATGRYLQSDPMGLAGGISTYAAVSSNPLNRIDPDGLRDIFVGGLGDATSGIVQSYYTQYHARHPDSSYYSWQDEAGILKGIANTPVGDPIHLIGHSYGGDTAAKAALASCRKVDLLITIDPVSHHGPSMQSIAASVGTWVDVDAEGGSAFNWDNILAGGGGGWNGDPNGIADLYIQDGIARHQAFSQMMSASGPGISSPEQILAGQPMVTAPYKRGNSICQCATPWRQSP